MRIALRRAAAGATRVLGCGGLRKLAEDRVDDTVHSSPLPLWERVDAMRSIADG
jgi:hypothetical protein